MARSDRGFTSICRQYFTRLASLILLLTIASSLLPGPVARAQDGPVNIEAILEAMTVADRVGQLFVVSFVGDNVSPASDIAELIRDYRVGGVVLLASNGNFRNLNPDGTPANTPEQVVSLANQLQALAFDGNLPTNAALAPSLGNVRRLEVPEDRGVTLPLFIAIDHEGDGYPFTRLFSGFTPLPSNMAVGATWSPEDAATVGRIVGKELSAVGINLLLGPSLDVLDRPRTDPRTSLGVRSFGGNPYWVGRLGRAYIGGVHEGSRGRLATVAKHFPGQGSSDRLPDDEVATIQKSAADLQAVELAPFVAVAKPGTLIGLLNGPAAIEPSTLITIPASTTTEALLSTHVRYAGLQGSSESIPPISLAPQLGQELLNRPGFAEWRKEQPGVMMSDALGAPAIRRYYDPTLADFPYKRVAQEALLAGNDLLTLSRFALTDNWSDQLSNIKETIEFFRDKYEADDDFRRRVDAAVLRILALKAQLYPELNLRSALVDGSDITQRVGQDSATIAQVARSAVTLISPSPTELAERMPTGPGSEDTVLVFTDSRTRRECFEASCPGFPLIPPTALEEIILRLYGPEASGQMTPARIRSLTFEQLSAYLNDQPTDPPGQEIERLIDEADWLVFAMLDEDSNIPASSALRQLLNQRPISRERKRLVAIAYNAPYFLGATDIAKLTAYFGVYAKTQPFLEASIRALFREFTPTGASPVDIPGISYSLTEQLQPDPDQVIGLELPDVRVKVGSNTFTAKVGQTLRVLAGPILDYNGRLVPDGTKVSFKLRQRSDQFELLLEETGTVDGFADASVILEQPGDFEVRVESGEASGSLNFILSIVDEAGGEAQIAVSTPTATPSPVPTTTPTPTATPSPTATATATPSPTATPTPVLPLPPPRVTTGSFGLALVSVLLIALAGFLVFGATTQVPASAVRNMLLTAIGGLTAYSLYGLGLLPGATWMQRQWRPWGAGLVALLGSSLPLLVVWIRQAMERRSS